VNVPKGIAVLHKHGVTGSVNFNLVAMQFEANAELNGTRRPDSRPDLSAAVCSQIDLGPLPKPPEDPFLHFKQLMECLADALASLVQASYKETSATSSLQKSGKSMHYKSADCQEFVTQIPQLARDASNFNASDPPNLTAL
jgi:hypothetical protein